MSQPAPGWYPDPAGSPRLRWWNGGMWTEQYQPIPTQRQAMPQQQMPQQGMQQGFPPQGAPQNFSQQGFPPQGGPQQGMPQQGFPQQGMPQQGAATSAQAGIAQGGGAQQTNTQKGPHLPSNKQAPTVSSNPYGSEPTFDQRKKDARDKKNEHTKDSKTSSRWKIATVAVWVAVVVFAVTTIIAGTSYSHARAELAPAVSERDDAQAQLDQSQQERDEAQKELEELQK